jgi:hypothetical protein
VLLARRSRGRFAVAILLGRGFRSPDRLVDAALRAGGLEWMKTNGPWSYGAGGALVLATVGFIW